MADFEGGIRRAGEGARRTNDLSRWQFDVDEIVPVFELLETEHVVEGQYRSDRGSDLESGYEELALGLRRKEFSDDLGEFLE